MYHNTIKWFCAVIYNSPATNPAFIEVIVLRYCINFSGQMGRGVTLSVFWHFGVNFAMVLFWDVFTVLQLLTCPFQLIYLSFWITRFPRPQGDIEELRVVDITHLKSLAYFSPLQCWCCRQCLPEWPSRGETTQTRFVYLKNNLDVFECLNN